MINSMISDRIRWSEPPHAVPPARTQVPSEQMEQMEQIVLPELYCPFASAVNRRADEVDAGTNAWVRSYRLFANEAEYKRFAAVRLGWLAARTHPTASLEDLQTVADWCAWFFIRDDYYDETGIGRYPQALVELHARFLEIVQGARLMPEDTALTHALHDLWRRTGATASDEWKQRFVRHLEQFFDAGVWEAENRASGAIPTVATYLKMRPLAGGLFAYIDLFDLTERVALPPELRNHPTLQRMVALANNMVCWSNDIMSLAKEIKHGEIHNLVLSMRQNQHLTLQEAVNRAAALHDSEVRAYIELELRLPSQDGVIDPELRRYTAVLRRFVRGSLDWLHTSKRYLIVGGTGPSFS